ncbi:MAG: glycoside hydrolase family 36 protein [Sphingorhabdus sp.]
MNAAKSGWAMLAKLGRVGIGFTAIEPLVDGAVPAFTDCEVGEDGMRWRLASGGCVVVQVESVDDGLGVKTRLEGQGDPLLSLGFRLTATGVQRYLRNGYQSWDGSFFVEPGTPPGDGPPGKAPTLGFAMTALLPPDRGTLLLGFLRHDRYQTRFRFGGDAQAMTIDIETLLDRSGATEGETLVLLDGDGVEESLRRWSEMVAAASPLPPRIPAERITGWCSWYNHYAMIDADTIRAEIASCAAFRDAYAVPLRVFQIDDGFTPEMGDWLDCRPQFPQGVAPLLAEARDAGFIPGLWIAPFMVGNRSRLYTDHPDWVVQDVDGGPLVQMRFYGEFRWHKRSEEYYILDVTHPDAAAYIGQVFRIWRQDWGAAYFKTDFMLFGSEHGPDRARWHQTGLSRIAIWRRMAAIIRDNIGDALWLGCGCPLWASVGYVDAVRIGRDIGVSWEGEYSAESLLRDLKTRNHANGILWQADPDCVLLRSRYHELNDAQIETLAHFAASAGGVLMTSDTLSDLPPARAGLFADLLLNPATRADFPMLGRENDQ